MPRPEELSSQRVEGRRCVWCGYGKPVVNLGRRVNVVDAALYVWNPQACLECVREQAAKTYGAHTATCAYCEPTLHCVEARALHALGHPTPAARVDASRGWRDDGRISLGGEERPSR
ncbi:hypothetical protein ACGFY9_13790 [Streptomyces sp. NPDC048504]|uniref:hypothetical protein n=1 Tax=Streptomyces sp. NPDC048504 TaxID=3365559 RepID=UPI00371BB93B